MLASSKEYIEALRAGKYLRFLEWPHFVIQHYCKDQTKPDADDLVTLLVFDLLNNGFCEDDAKKVALIDAAAGLESFGANLNYSLTSISIAIFQYMIYDSKGIKHRFVHEEAKTRVEILKFMKRAANCLDISTFNDSLVSQQKQFFEWSKTADPKAVVVAGHQIGSIAVLRSALEDYLISLKAAGASKDQLILSRISIANKLGEYLSEQTDLTPTVIEEVSIYVNKIRSMQPLEFEHHYLNTISPLSLSDNTWQFFANFGMGFFKLLQKPESTSVPVAGKENGL